MSKPELKLIQGDLANIPDRVDFTCHDCKQPAVMYPLGKPISVMHSLPPCAEWKRIESDMDDLARYLIKCGVHVHVPGSIVPN